MGVAGQKKERRAVKVGRERTRENREERAMMNEDDKIDLLRKRGVYVRSSLLLDWHMLPDSLHDIQANVCKAENWFLVDNVATLCQDGSPWIHDLSDTDIREEVGKQAMQTGGDEYAGVSPKGVGNNNRINIPWRAPNFLGSGCAVPLQQRLLHRFAFRWQDFEGGSSDEPLRSWPWKL